MGAYPPGCTQAMHDAAFGNETREKCQTCEGTGHRNVDGVLDCERPCVDCEGTGYETPSDTRTDDAYEASLEQDPDIDF